MIDIYNRLGSDLTYIPLVETTDEMEQIISLIKMILGTKGGDVLGSPYFGVDIKKYIFNLSYNLDEINRIVTLEVLSNISYDESKYDVAIKVDFGKDHYNKSDYAIINIYINLLKYLGIMMTQ